MKTPIMILMSIFIISCDSTKKLQKDTPSLKTEITYEGTIKKIIKMNCILCHSSNKSSGGFSLKTYDKVRFYAEEGNLLTKINDKDYPMPTKGLMSIEQRKAIEVWASKGFKK